MREGNNAKLRTVNPKSKPYAFVNPRKPAADPVSILGGIQRCTCQTYTHTYIHTYMHIYVMPAPWPMAEADIPQIRPGFV